jgi:hypothetical protein
MVDLKNVISLIEIKFLKKVSSILREDGSNKRWIVMFEGETKTKFIQLDNKDLEIINQFRILKYN